ncbi:MAG: class I SAM-dependent methyltransferase, partial [Candidatus Acidiferrales bacterium]
MRKVHQRVLVALIAAFFATCIGAGVLALQDRGNESNWPSRDRWQRPQEVMDELGLAQGSAVADVGAGRGYFTFRLAERVGKEGKVYAVDLDERDLGRIRSRAKEEGLTQIEIVHSDAADPRLPAESVDVIIVVNAYHEMRDYDAMLQGMFRALRRGGRLAIIDEDAQPGKSRNSYYSSHEIPESLVREDAQRNGFRYLRSPQGFRNADGDPWYFLLFEKPVANAALR